MHCDAARLVTKHGARSGSTQLINYIYYKGYETTEPYRPPEENNQRGDRDGFRGGRGGRGGFRGRGSGRGGNRGNYGGGGGNYGGGFSRGGGQNQVVITFKPKPRNLKKV